MRAKWIHKIDNLNIEYSSNYTMKIEQYLNYNHIESNREIIQNKRFM